MILTDVGLTTPIYLRLKDGATGKGVRAFVEDGSGGPMATLSLPEISTGFHLSSYTFPVAGQYLVHFFVYTDPTYAVLDAYERLTEAVKVQIPLTPENIAGAIWEALLIDHNNPCTMGWVMNLLSHYDPALIADAVWDELTAPHQIPSTFGEYIHVIRRFVLDNFDALYNGVWGLQRTFEQINIRADEIIAEVNQNEHKIDAINPNVDARAGEILTAISLLDPQFSAITAELGNVEGVLLAEIGVAESKIDSVGAKVDTLQNNTTTRFVVPERLIKPDSGIKDYQFHLRLYDNIGNPEAPDVTPTIRVKRLDTGAVIINDVAMTQDGIKIGAYYYVYHLASGYDDCPLLVEATVTENGVARYVPAVSEITEFESDLNAIEAELGVVHSVVEANHTELVDPAHGLVAIRSAEGAIAGQITHCEGVVNQVKARSDLIPDSPATSGQVGDVESAVFTRPTIVDIQARLTNLGEDLKGSDGRDLTQVFDRWDTGHLLKDYDPRLNYLDASISSRSTLTAPQVWSYGTRTLTDFNLSLPNIKAIWDYLASSASVPGSLGKRISDFLDAPMSQAATSAEMEYLLTGVAREATVSGLYTHVTNEANQNEVKINQVQATINAVKADTDHIPSDPAHESTIVSGFAAAAACCTDVKIKIDQVRAKTNNLPVDPARQASVMLIPTDPVRVNDPRLTNLDVKVSTRSTLSLSDLAGLASSGDLAALRIHLEADLAAIASFEQTIKTDTVHIITKTDHLPSDPASVAAVNAARDVILDALPEAGGSSLTAADVWDYPSRLITNDPDDFKADVSGLATHAEVQALAFYECRLNAVYRDFDSTIELMVWAEKEGLRAIGDHAAIDLKDSLGNTLLSFSGLTPNSDGMFRVEHAVTLQADVNLYAVISIFVDGALRTSQQPLFTVG